MYLKTIRILLIIFVIQSSCKNPVSESFADIIINNDSLNFHLTNWSVSNRTDTTIINFSDTDQLSNYYSLQLIKIGDSANLLLSQDFSITDSSYKKPKFKTIEQSIIFNKTNNSNQVSGSIHAFILSENTWPSVFLDTLKIDGNFVVIIH